VEQKDSATADDPETRKQILFLNTEYPVGLLKWLGSLFLYVNKFIALLNIVMADVKNNNLNKAEQPGSGVDVSSNTQGKRAHGGCAHGGRARLEDVQDKVMSFNV